MSNDTLIGPNFDASPSPEFKAKLREALRGDQRTATVINDLISERHQDRARIAVLEAALRTVRGVISSDSVEYDDVRNAEQIIDKALESSQSETEKLGTRTCNCGWPRTSDGEHGDECPAREPDSKQQEGQ